MQYHSVKFTEVGMFQLTVDPEVQDASVLVHWCLTPETQEALKQHAKGEPKLLLVVSAGSERSESRTLIPLGNVTQHITVSHPGPNTIFSAIVWPGDYTSNLKEEYLSRYSRGYRTDVITYPDQGQPRFIAHMSPTEGYLRGIRGPSVEVRVPGQVFAKQPPKWEQRWVGWILIGHAADQCAYRRKRLFAYTIQPILGLVWACFLGVYGLALGAVSILFLAAGFYKLNYREGFHGFQMDRLWDYGKITAEHNFWRRIWQALLPITQEEARRREIELQEKARIRRQQREEAQRAALASLYQALTCRADASLLKPPTRRMIVLRFQDLKAMVCKPFAG